MKKKLKNTLIIKKCIIFVSQIKKMAEKLFLNIMMSLLIFFLLTSPHIIYMITYDSNIYVNSSGEVVKDITAYGFSYSLLGILTCSFLSVILGTLLTNRITK